MSTVRFSYADKASISLPNKKSVKKFIVQVFEQEGKLLKAITYVFCSDKYLLNINKHFLKHDYFTDIITFDLSDSDMITGEVYISSERVKENSSTLSIPFANELLRVMFHGALHLIGYKDKRKSEITIMRQKEDYYLRLFEKK